MRLKSAMLIGCLCVIVRPMPFNNFSCFSNRSLDDRNRSSVTMSNGTQYGLPLRCLLIIARRLKRLLRPQQSPLLFRTSDQNLAKIVFSSSGGRVSNSDFSLFSIAHAKIKIQNQYKIEGFIFRKSCDFHYLDNAIFLLPKIDWVNYSRNQVSHDGIRMEPVGYLILTTNSTL